MASAVELNCVADANNAFILNISHHRQTWKSSVHSLLSGLKKGKLKITSACDDFKQHYFCVECIWRMFFINHSYIFPLRKKQFSQCFYFLRVHFNTKNHQFS